MDNSLRPASNSVNINIHPNLFGVDSGAATLSADISVNGACAVACEIFLAARASTHYG